MADDVVEVFDGDLEIEPSFLGGRPPDLAFQAVQEMVSLSH